MGFEAVRQEQEYVDMLYARVDELRDEADVDLARAHRDHGGGAQDLVDRDARVVRLAERRVQLTRVEHQLCFGRLDRRDGSMTYIGRMGLRDEGLEPLLVDWRAPVASDFYTATAASGSDVLRRRHLRTEGRTVVGVNDELLDLDRVDGVGDFVGEAALMETLSAHRTGRMGEIVATLQGEQDEIIRSRPEGVLVVQGGPGTGKTAVALHRAAFLLYTHPRIAERGVLVVGPNATFLRYIGQVLPSLGETSVVLATPGTVLPGVPADRAEPAGSARLKGSPEMAEVVAAAVRDRQGTDETVEVVHDDDVLEIPGETIGNARTRALQEHAQHNLARRRFREQIWAHLACAVVEQGRRLLEEVEQGFEQELRGVDRSLARGADDLPAEVDASGTEVTGAIADHELDRVREELAGDPGVAAVVEGLWPALTPEDLLGDLFGDADRLACVAPELGRDERELLLHRPGDGWSVADIPLLDEAAELLGVDELAETARSTSRHATEVRYARQVLDGAGIEGVSAGDVAERYAERDSRSIAERAAADRTWAYGHLVVDEAQELSPMQWRMLLRRVPSGSVTVVGDVNQTTSLGGSTSWDVVGGIAEERRVRVAELTVSYRTPGVVMDAAAPVLATLDAGASPPVSARPGGEQPWRVDARGDLAGTAAELTADELDRLDGGHLAVICSERALPTVTDAVTERVPGTSSGPEPDLESRCVVITPAQAKGLEFDGVVVVDVAGVLDGPRGLSALYIAMTRPTTRLGVVHDGSVPDVVAHLPARSQVVLNGSAGT